MSRYGFLMAPLAVSLVVLGPAAAQTTSPTSPRPESAPPAASPSPRYDSPASAGTVARASGMLEGSVKKVDPGAGTVQVSSGPLGLFGRTLEFTNGTQVQVDGRPGSVADIREGAKIKASYEARDGRNIATRIEVMPGQDESRSRVRDKMDRTDTTPSTRRSQ